MMYNPNNVATEASPFTTEKERDVGRDLCVMLGYRYEGNVSPWGHITCVSDSVTLVDWTTADCYLGIVAIGWFSGQP